MTRTFTRVAFAALLATGVGLATEVSALASAPGDHATSAPAQKKKKKPTLKAADSSLGEILVTNKGLTLYVFDPDGTDTVASKCVDACADVWPAYAPTKKPKVGKGLDASLAGVGGGGQATYNSHLLYLFSGDSAAGQANGQGIGGVWHVMGADGNPIV